MLLARAHIHACVSAGVACNDLAPFLTLALAPEACICILPLAILFVRLAFALTLAFLPARPGVVLAFARDCAACVLPMHQLVVLLVLLAFTLTCDVVSTVCILS